MTIICPECGTPYRLPGGMVPTQKSAAKCKKCGTRMIISPGKQGDNDIGEIPLAENNRTSAESVTQSSNDSYLADQPESDNVTEDLLSNSVVDEDVISVFPELGEIPTDRFILSAILSKNRKGDFCPKKNRVKVKLLLAVAPLLTEKVLLKNEQVLRIAKGSAYYPWEIPYANGIFTLQSNYFAIICTNFRLLLVNIDYRIKKPARYLYQIFYDEVVQVSRGMFLTSLAIYHRNGSSWNFTSVGMSLSRELKDLILLRKKEGPSTAFSKTPGVQLCPQCYDPVNGSPLQCPSCHSTFKAPSAAFKRAFLLPGLGSLYLGYIPLGIIELSTYFCSWIIFLVLLYLKLPGIIPIWVITLIVIHSFSGITSLKLGQKGLIVKDVKTGFEKP